MSDIVEFLLARVAEDEAVAREAIDPERPGTHWEWFDCDTDKVAALRNDEWGTVSLRTVEEFPTRVVGPLPAFALDRVEVDEGRALPHIARHNPARVLAECEAKRRIVEAHRPLYAVAYRESDRLLADAFDRDKVRTAASSGPIWPTLLSEDTLAALAQPYADHPDFDPAWRV